MSHFEAEALKEKKRYQAEIEKWNKAKKIEEEKLLAALLKDPIDDCMEQESESKEKDLLLLHSSAVSSQSLELPQSISGCVFPDKEHQELSICD
eukprot:8917559-Ditylum_brightwellii.AAC.1